jgi:hypothetical protein
MYTGVPMIAAVWVLTLLPASLVSLGDAEVEDLGALAAGDLAVGHEEDVLGLEIAVDDASPVGGVERRRDLAQDPQRVLGRQATEALEARVEGLALEELHDDVGRCRQCGSRSRRSARCRDRRSRSRPGPR